MRIMRALAVTGGLALSACGGSTTTPSTTPSTPLNLAGTWTGTWTFLSGGATVSDTVTMTLTQSDASASGPWSAAGGAAGTVAFATTADFTGTASIRQILINGVNCSSSTTLTGTATSNQIRFTLIALAPAGLCQWATNNQFTFSR